MMMVDDIPHTTHQLHSLAPQTNLPAKLKTSPKCFSYRHYKFGHYEISLEPRQPLELREKHNQTTGRWPTSPAGGLICSWSARIINASVDSAGLEALCYSSIFPEGSCWSGVPFNVVNGAEILFTRGTQKTKIESTVKYHWSLKKVMKKKFGKTKRKKYLFS